MKLYKVLDKNGESCNGGNLKWGLPRGKRPGRWESVKGDLLPCKNGIHLCRRGDLIEWFGPSIFLAEHDGELFKDKNKVVVRRARLVQRMHWDDSIARLFAADCAERALKRAKVEDERSWNAIHVARGVARGDLSVSELAAARAAAAAAAWAAAWDAARDAAWAAARAAAWDAAWAAARDAAWAAAWDAARDAELKWQTRRLFEYIEGKCS